MGNRNISLEVSMLLITVGTGINKQQLKITSD